MGKKKIEPTDAMVQDTERARWFMGPVDRAALGVILRVALNHPDAPGLFADEDALRAAREQGWDQATLWIDSYQGGPNGRTTSARSANPHRPVQELPTEDGAVIVPADGHEYITATFDGETYRAREAILLGSGHWQAAWRSDEGVMVYVIAEWIDPGTCQVADQ